jgi:tRNA (adenine-N(1)-)-methyltransferase non-catalytic subunit
LKKVEDDKFFDTEIDIESLEAVAAPSDGKGDNRSYVDTNTAQKLDSNDIQRMRESGATGAEIIKSLIANSDTWGAKTEFAQEKWLKRKHKKYIRRMRIIKSSPATICEVYHNKSKDKICSMRWDTLAQCLSQSGIRAGSRVLVFETLTGLMVGSVAYKLKGHGRIFAAFAGQQPHNEICSALNLDVNSINIIQVHLFFLLAGSTPWLEVSRSISNSMGKKKLTPF